MWQGMRSLNSNPAPTPPSPLPPFTQVLAFFMLHCYQLWSRHIADPSHGPWQWSTIASDALQFNLLPLAAFLVVRGLVVLGSSFNGQLNGMRPWVR